MLSSSYKQPIMDTDAEAIGIRSDHVRMVEFPDRGYNKKSWRTCRS